jgi:hypothetical protein
MSNRPRSRKPTQQDIQQWEENSAAMQNSQFQSFEAAIPTRWDGGQPHTPPTSHKQSRHSNDTSRYSHEQTLSSHQVESMAAPFSPPATPAAPPRHAPTAPATPASLPIRPVQSLSATSRTRVATGNEGKEWVDRFSGTGLQDNKESRFLDAIDDIRKHALDCRLDIPELVVCGSQSSGKSSVLEAITRVPFPRGDTTCTRFVTQYVDVSFHSLLHLRPV